MTKKDKLEKGLKKKIKIKKRKKEKKNRKANNIKVFGCCPSSQVFSSYF